MSAASEVAKASACTVYYDGACPLCRREISFYRRRKGAEAVSWVDVAEDDAPKDLGPGLDAETAMARFHVRDVDGRLYSGAAGFAALWSTLPQWRSLGRLAASPLIGWALERAYTGFLKMRPWLQRRAASRG